MALFCTVSLTSCSALGPRSTPIKDPATPLEFEGFSLLPPAGEGWYLLASDETGAVLTRGKNPLVISQSAFVVGREEPFEAFLQGCRVEIEEEAHSARFRNARSEFEPVDGYGTRCERYHWTVEDHGVPGLAKGEYMILEASGLILAHPEIPDLTLRAEYSERRRPGNPAAMDQDLVDAFFRGLRLRPGTLPMRYGDYAPHVFLSASWSVPAGKVDGFGETGTFATRPASELYDPGLGFVFQIGFHSPSSLFEVEADARPTTLTDKGQQLLNDSQPEGRETEIEYVSVGLFYGKCFLRQARWAPFAGLYGSMTMARLTGGTDEEPVIHEGFTVGARVGIDWELADLGGYGTLILRSQLRVPLHSWSVSAPDDFGIQLGLGFSRGLRPMM